MPPGCFFFFFGDLELYGLLAAGLADGSGDIAPMAMAVALRHGANGGGSPMALLMAAPLFAPRAWR